MTDIRMEGENVFEDVDDCLSISIKRETSDKGIPYVELMLSYYEDRIDITFRAYPKNIFVAVEDNSENRSGGQDLDDCYLAPSVIVLKVSKQDFAPKDAYVKVMKYVRDYPDWMIDDDYKTIEGKIGEWMAMWRQA